MPTTSSPHSSGQRAPLMRRQSSQSSQTSKHGVASPGSGGECQPLRHPVKPARRTKIVLPRNHSSARDLAKLARQTQNQNQNQNHHAGEEGKKSGRRSTHEGDTEIRLPGSLDESKEPPQMRRNMTAYQLPRNTSYTKLKKNLSHGQLTRLGSSKNLANMNTTASKGPPSPGLKNRKHRPKSADMTSIMKDLHEQEVEIAEDQRRAKEGPKKVGFAVGSSGDSEEEAPDMEGSGMQEDEWTDQSASASPYSTRQNTANNSRRPSTSVDKPPDKRVLLESSKGKASEPLHHAPHHLSSEVKQETESSGTQGEEEEDSDSSEPPSPRSQPHVKKREEEVKPEQASQQPSQQPSQPQIQVRSPLHAAKEPSNPATRYLMSRTQSGAQAQVTFKAPTEENESARASPAPSMRSSRSNLGNNAGDPDQEELVSRFVPSASHPSTGSVSGTMNNTPKTSSFHTPVEESTLAAQNRDKPATSFSLGPTSPGSTISGSSGAATPAMGRSRTELRMMNEKAVADLEEAAARNPVIPPHVYDRRNESLKTFLSSTQLQRDAGSKTNLNPHFNLGPELFQGRFKAVNTELKVVQRFRDPIADSVRRLERCKGSNFSQLRSQRVGGKKSAAKMPISTSKSAVSLARPPSKLSTSTSPPNSASPVKPAMSSAKSATSIQRASSSRGGGGRVTFSQTPPETRGVEGEEGIAAADTIARQLWDGPMS